VLDAPRVSFNSGLAAKKVATTCSDHPWSAAYSCAGVSVRTRGFNTLDRIVGAHELGAMDSHAVDAVLAAKRYWSGRPRGEINTGELTALGDDKRGTRWIKFIRRQSPTA
jgi:hypothetical protein